ncbi:hypothetical protein CDD83_11009 [Cordyceps sp. RAO-2017]|nr:hypothetical protein CDD83_11009 [Cordyceps sp. RAO-2017]
MEFEMAIDWLAKFAAMEVKDEVIEDNDERTIVQTYPPLGVCCGIVPWNWPVLTAICKLGPALMTGNTMILKPSPFTPYCDLKLGEIGARVFPPGVLQVLSGDDDLGPWLTEHPDIDKVNFTGSIATGKAVMQSCSKTLKRVTLELGGNDPAIVCDDVDLDVVVPKITTVAFLNSSQICMVIKRIYVHEKIYDKFMKAMVAFAKNIKTGDGFESDVLVGPIQNAMQYEKVKEFYADVAKSKWKHALEGQVLKNRKGYFITPTIIDNPPEDSQVVVEEPFGPIVPVMKWSDEDDVIHRANNTKTGLGASVWTDVPFGGHKWSGIGNENGMTGMKSYCNSRSLWKWKKVM